MIVWLVRASTWEQKSAVSMPAYAAFFLKRILNKMPHIRDTKERFIVSSSLN